MCGFKLFDDVLFLLYVNLRISPNSGEVESLVLGKLFIINVNIFEDVFGTMFSNIIPYINGIWLDYSDVPLKLQRESLLNLKGPYLYV